MRIDLLMNLSTLMAIKVWISFVSYNLLRMKAFVIWSSHFDLSKANFENLAHGSVWETAI